VAACNWPQVAVYIHLTIAEMGLCKSHISKIKVFNDMENRQKNEMRLEKNLSDSKVKVIYLAIFFSRRKTERNSVLS